MIHDKKILLKEAQRIANENGAPVWYEYNLKFSAYFIHETPPPDYKKNVPIIEPNGLSAVLDATDKKEIVVQY